MGLKPQSFNIFNCIDKVWTAGEIVVSSRSCSRPRWQRCLLCNVFAEVFASDQAASRRRTQVQDHCVRWGGARKLLQWGTQWRGALQSHQGKCLHAECTGTVLIYISHSTFEYGVNDVSWGHHNAAKCHLAHIIIYLLLIPPAVAPYYKGAAIGRAPRLGAVVGRCNIDLKYLLCCSNASFHSTIDHFIFQICKQSTTHNTHVHLTYLQLHSCNLLKVHRHKNAIHLYIYLKK